MDTSETFIKMRLKAIPDLGMGKPPEAMPDEYYSFQSMTIFIDGKGDWYYSTVDECVQLERQDQLQDMVNAPLWNLNHRFSSWLYDINEDGMCDFHIKHTHIEATSMEQLWLAFVQKELHNKTWSGEDWV